MTNIKIDTFDLIIIIVYIIGILFIGLWCGLEEKGMPASEIEALTRQCMVLPDYKGNPRVANAAEMVELVNESYKRCQDKG